MSGSTTRALALGLIVVLLALPGCGTIRVGSGPIAFDTEKGLHFRGESSFMSSLGAGGLTYGLMSATGGANAAQWAAAVGMTSFVANEIVQKEVERRRAEHQRESEYLDSEIAIAEKSVDERQTELGRIEKELAKQERAVADLEKQRRDDAAFARRAEKTLASLDDLIKRLDAEREVAEAEIEIYTEAVRSSRSKTDDSVSEAEMEARRKELLARRDERLRQYELVVARGEKARSLKKRVEEIKP
jgi:septal ring factor EnvC (AmiA/AmiB activator)